MNMKVFAFLKTGNKNDEICSNSYPSYFGASCVSVLAVEHLSLLTNQNNAVCFVFFTLPLQKT